MSAIARRLMLPALLLVAGCSANRLAPAVPSLLPFAQPAVNPVSTHIKHVVVIFQENRTLVNFFAGYPGANAPTFGCSNHTGSAGRRFAGAPAADADCPAGDVKIPLTEITFNGPILGHNWSYAMTDWNNGRMDGFYNAEQPNPTAAYSYVKRALVKPYWDMAQQYVLSDAMFPTEFGGSFTGHLTFVAGTDNLTPSHAVVDFPSNGPPNCDAPQGTKTSYIDRARVRYYLQGPFPCFDQFNTMAEVLDKAGVSWKYYATTLVGAGLWEPFEAIKYVRYGPDWNKDIIVPQTRILTDPAKGNLASVTWVAPSKPDSDHPGARSDRGPSWVASIVNAVGESEYWKDTAIVVTWDDWGGWYDNAKPPQLDYRGLAIRVPCLIISPYAKAGDVSHTRYEYGSILKFIERAFLLPNIGPASEGYSDVRANSLEDSFDFTQKPRPFKPIASKYGRADFLSEPRSREPVDTE